MHAGWRNYIRKGSVLSKLCVVLEEKDFEGFIRPQQIRYNENERAARASLD